VKCGASAAGALWDNWSASFEYLHLDLGTTHDSFAGVAPFGQISANSRITGNIVRVGLNTRFAWN
jgi:hypothetical protein